MAGLTQAEVAQRAGLSQQMVGQYETGGRQPSVTTLTRLIAGCGLHLRWSLVPDAGLADQPTCELLAKPHLERLDPRIAAAFLQLARAFDGLPMLVGGKTAARLHGADIRAFEIEFWVDDRVDLSRLTFCLQQVGAEYVSPMGAVEPPAAELDRLRGGWPLVALDAELELRAVQYFDRLVQGATTLALGSDRQCLVVGASDCAARWHDRDLDHLALQRAVRLSSENKQ
jgi:transcriptional regulator with XRE-family HTH domain